MTDIPQDPEQAYQRGRDDLWEEVGKLVLIPRSKRLLWEMVTMIDPDTLNQNLDTVGVEETTLDELDALAALLDADGEFNQEWVNTNRNK